VGDKGYDGKRNRVAARERGICPVIPFKSSAKNRPRFFAKALYRARARIEQLVGKLKRFKRVAPLREDGPELRLLCCPRPRLHPHQIRPHRLALLWQVCGTEWTLAPCSAEGSRLEVSHEHLIGLGARTPVLA